MIYHRTYENVTVIPKGHTTGMLDLRDLPRTYDARSKVMGENVQNFLWGYLALINIVGFGLMIYDKYKAKRKGWRVPELRFFIIAFLGGAVGVYLGMRIVRHKTKHALFVYGIPILILINLGLLIYLGLGRM